MCGTEVVQLIRGVRYGDGVWFWEIATKVAVQKWCTWSYGLAMERAVWRWRMLLPCGTTRARPLRNSPRGCPCGIRVWDCHTRHAPAHTPFE
eukprot:3937771-Rhodomonas_salina.1